MSEDVLRVQSELHTLGYKSSLHNWTHGTVVEFDYLVEVGSHKGKVFRLGVSFQETGYPEYPPHWIHISPAIDDEEGRRVRPYTADDGREWIALSRPPSDIWDNLLDKNMKNYLEEHVRRFWRFL